jgi:hypothetical protein
MELVNSIITFGYLLFRAQFKNYLGITLRLSKDLPKAYLKDYIIFIE